ncbi:predicted protein [Arabidopsis lyrata subsp. lyrata]|uniref:Predicted protein n=1 Tax=Arabidopsis lyrata subsp. lyrata TaxID=81972 RepID=D7KKK1_ARALL|nr:predicted protein [Arabidopsis lyrata subsp. lyrata]
MECSLSSGRANPNFNFETRQNDGRKMEKRLKDDVIKLRTYTSFYIAKVPVFIRHETST